jgi:prepilin-type N-terminal cleavage/methylation domain-containing protein
MSGSVKKQKANGFTLVELLFVIATIGILAAIAIPNFLSHRRRTYNSSAHVDIENVYTSAQVYYTDYPAGATTNLNDFKAYGFKQTKNVVVIVRGTGTSGAFSAESFHESGDKTYRINFDGGITDSL